jgi:hypothetical protein
VHIFDFLQVHDVILAHLDTMCMGKWTRVSTDARCASAPTDAHVHQYDRTFSVMHRLDTTGMV